MEVAACETQHVVCRCCCGGSCSSSPHRADCWPHLEEAKAAQPSSTGTPCGPSLLPRSLALKCGAEYIKHPCVTITLLVCCMLSALASCSLFPGELHSRRA